MAYSLVTHAGAISSNGSDATTGSLNTTGANLIVVVAGWFGGTVGSVTDSKSNTYTALFDNSAGSRGVQLYYCYAPTVGSGHTVTLAAGFPAVDVLVFSGAAASPFDQESHDVVSQPGSITPSEDNCVLVLGCVDSDTGTRTVDQSFTVGDQNDNAGNSVGTLSAYLIQTTAGAKNPTVSPGSGARTVMASFKASAGGGGGGVAAPLSLYSSRAVRRASFY